MYSLDANLIQMKRFIVTISIVIIVFATIGYVLIALIAQNLYRQLFKKQFYIHDHSILTKLIQVIVLAHSIKLYLINFDIIICNFITLVSNSTIQIVVITLKSFIILPIIDGFNTFLLTLLFYFKDQNCSNLIYLFNSLLQILIHPSFSFLFFISRLVLFTFR